MEHTNTSEHALHIDSTSRPGRGAPAVLLTVDEAGAQLALSRSTVYALMNSGELRSVRFGVSRRIPQSAVDELIERKLLEATPGEVQETAPEHLSRVSDWNVPSAPHRGAPRRRGGS